MRHSAAKVLTSIAILASLSLPTYADSSPPKPSCTKPDNPGTLASDVRMKGFQKEVDSYRDCVNKFAQEQKTAAETHTTAGNKAIEDFNLFVKTEMNPK